MSNTKVFLVGAGPGDPGLITVRGLELVRAADVIIHDQLGTAEFLSQAKEDCELFDVGKFAGNHKVTQDETNELLVTKALEGKLVVRLKGGDPFVFGRGGEELLYLAEAGIRAEVVPGVTSAISAPCYAGIPITQRGYTVSMAIVTGHEAEKDASEINWQALAGIGTVVFLMGVKNLPLIAENLIKAGRAKETPVALVQNGTMPTQRTVTGTLETIAQIAVAAGIKPPTVTVVGEVVSLREKLQWFESRPLFGRTIVVTRSREQASSLCAELRIAGARVIECPTIKIVQHAKSPEFAAFIEEAENYKHLVFTSVNGVTGFVSSLFEAGLDMRFLAGKKVICIGPATAEAFMERGIVPDFVPETYVAEALLPYFSQLAPSGVAILRAEKAREILPQTLAQIGHRVKVVSIYHTDFARPDSSEVFEAFAENAVDLVTFTSSSTAEGFARIIENSQIKCNQVKAASIGPITTQTCQEIGFKIETEASDYTIPGLIEAMIRYFASKQDKS